MGLIRDKILYTFCSKEHRYRIDAVFFRHLFWLLKPFSYCRYPDDWAQDGFRGEGLQRNLDLGGWQAHGPATWAKLAATQMGDTPQVSFFWFEVVPKKLFGQIEETKEAGQRPETRGLGRSWSTNPNFSKELLNRQLSSTLFPAFLGHGRCSWNEPIFGSFGSGASFGYRTQSANLDCPFAPCVCFVLWLWLWAPPRRRWTGHCSGSNKMALWLSTGNKKIQKAETA